MSGFGLGRAHLLQWKSYRDGYFISLLIWQLGLRHVTSSQSVGCSHLGHALRLEEVTQRCRGRDYSWWKQQRVQRQGHLMVAFSPADFWIVGAFYQCDLPVLPPLQVLPNLPPPHSSSKFDFLFKLARDGFCCLQSRTLSGVEASGQKRELYQWFPFLFLFCFVLFWWRAGSWFPDQGSNLCPWQLRCGILTTGPQVPYQWFPIMDTAMSDRYPYQIWRMEGQERGYVGIGSEPGRHITVL